MRNRLVDDILLSDLPHAPTVRLDSYLKRDGYRGLEKALSMTPGEVVGEIKRSGLRGRGGAGYPTGQKWEMVIQRKGSPKYVCCNAHEDEPGTLKDRYLLHSNPHLAIEGILIACYAIGAREAYLYLNGDFAEEIPIVREACEEAKKGGFVGERILNRDFSVDLKIYVSSSGYVAGEETAMLEVIEGRPAFPRQKPPNYPAYQGLYKKPTLVNNVETFSHVPLILLNGAQWFASVGKATSPGTMIFTLTGDVRRPGLYELPLGTSLRTLIYDWGGGIRNGNRLKAVFPGGPSFGPISSENIDCDLDVDALKKIGSGLGTGGVIVIDETACMVKVALKYARFFSEESCGQCPPCVMGTENLVRILARIDTGEGSEKDLDSIDRITQTIKGKGYCYLVTEASQVVGQTLTVFREEYKRHIKEKQCPFRRECD